MTAFEDLKEAGTEDDARSTIIGYAQAAGLVITSWIVGDVGQQILEVCTKLLVTVETVRAKLVRSFASLDDATDPGDDDPADPNNINLPAEPGGLSNLGRNVYGTTRTEETFATGEVTFVNAGSQARTFKPYALVFTWTLNTPPTPAKTYRNTPDASVYTNPDGSVTVLPSQSVTLPVVAEERGTGSNTPPNSLSLTTTLIGCTATNGSAIRAVPRETAPAFRARCKKAAARLSFGSPAEAIEYLATTTLDGEPLTNEDGDTVAITKTYASNDSATGEVDAFYASAAGGAALSDADRDAANLNIESNAYAVMDCVTFTGAKATDVTVTVAGTGRLTNPSAAAITAAKAAIVAALQAYFDAFPIGGLNQTAGAGTLYKVDLQAIAANAYPGLFNVVVTTPVGDTALAEGRIAVLSTAVGSWTIT